MKPLGALLIAIVFLTLPGKAMAQAAPNPAADLAKIYDAGVGAFAHGDYPAAISSLEQVLQQAGPDAKLESLYFTLGAAYYNLQQFSKAIETLKTYQSKYPQGARYLDATFSIGQAALFARDYDEAVSQFTQLFKVPQFREQAMYEAGYAYKEGGKTDQAIQTLEALISPEIRTGMKRYIVVALLSAVPVVAQQPAAGPPPINIILKDGRTVSTTQALERSGNAVMVTVPAGANQQAKFGYDLSAISRIEFPEPPQIPAAIDLLAAGQTGQGIAELGPVLTYYAPFRDVPGSWWSRAAVLTINELINSGRESEAAPLVAELSSCQGDPEAVCAAAVQHAASMARSGSYEAALQSLDASIEQSRNKDTLAQAWLYKGDCLLALRRLDPAILAYLHVPVFYSDEKLLVPQAMLGGARAMIGLQDRKSARDQLDELIKNFPSSPQATVAKTELDKIVKDQNQKP